MLENIEHSEHSEHIEQILENSNIHILTEGTDSQDISGTQQILTTLVQEKYNNSLLYKVCDVLPLTGTLGSIYVSKKKFNSNDFEIIKKQVVPTTKIINTSYTQEVYDDMRNMFGKSAAKSTGRVLRGISDLEENTALLDLLETESTIRSNLQIPSDMVIADILLAISQKVSSSVLEMNHYSFKTLDSFCILPRKYAAIFLGYFNYAIDGNENEKLLHLGKVGTTDYYLNPLTPDTSKEFVATEYNDAFTIGSFTDTNDPIFVGLHSKDPGLSSIIFSPYSYETKYVNDPDTFENVLFLYNRYGLNTSPLHLPLEKNSLLHKFNIEIT